MSMSVGTAHPNDQDSWQEARFHVARFFFGCLGSDLTLRLAAHVSSTAVTDLHVCASWP
jgi:hypothetical protein